MLTKEQYSQIKEELDSCKNPLFFFDDDQDGLCSFLQFYRYKQEGHGIIVKTTPKIGSVFIPKMREYLPDRIFVLDLSDIEQEFLDEAKSPVIWIDHHSPQDRKKVKYFNPRVKDKDDNQPTSYLCYNAIKNDLWIATLGCVADWYIPDFISEFEKKFPDLINYDYKSAGDIIYNTKLGVLIRIFSFVLKGKTNEVMKCIKVLTRITSPLEILNQSSSQGKFIYKKYMQIDELYQPLLKDFLEKVENEKGKLVVYIYGDDKMSFTSDLSNEAIYRFPDKVILIAREKNGDMKCSMRSSKILLPQIVQKALAGLNGYGGGHEHACGINVRKDDFEEFVKRLKELI